MFSQRKNFSVQLESHDVSHDATDMCREKFGFGPEDDLDAYFEEDSELAGAFSQCEEAALFCMNMTDEVEYCMGLMTTAAEKMPELQEMLSLTSDEADDIFQQCAPCAFESHEDEGMEKMCSTALTPTTKSQMFETYGMSCHDLLSEMGL
jgi:hypothetical protein